MDIVLFFSQNFDALLLVTGILSLFIGSFLNVVIYRLPIMLEHSWSEECRIYLGLKPHHEQKKLNLFLPLSHCPSCKKKIKPWNNIPLVSFLFLGGRCANCKARISLRYFLVELLTCFMSVYVVWRFGFSYQSLAGLLFSWIIIVLTFIDLDHHLLPDHLTLSLVWLGLFFSIFSIFCNMQESIIGGIAGYLIFAVTQWIFELLTGKVGMGQGDLKFLAGIGTFLGWEMLPLVILLASLSGVIFAFAQMAIKNQFKSVPLPFGPYLAIAGWTALLWGNEMMQYYFQVF